MRIDKYSVKNIRNVQKVNLGPKSLQSKGSRVD